MDSCNVSNQNTRDQVFLSLSCASSVLLNLLSSGIKRKSYSANVSFSVLTMLCLSAM